MRFLTRMVLQASILSAVFIGQAMADITAQEAWTKIRTNLIKNGFKLKSSEVQSGNTLSIHDLALSRTLTDVDGSRTGRLSLSLSRLHFIERAGGTVAIIIMDPTPLVVKVENYRDVAAELHLDITHKNLKTSISGHPQDLRYRYAADRLGLTLQRLLIDGIELPNNGVNAAVEISDLKGSTLQSTALYRRISQYVEFGELKYNIKIKPPEEAGDSVRFSGVLANLSFAGNMVLPQNPDWSDLIALFTNGASLDGSWQTGASKSDVAIRNYGSKMAYSTASNSQVGAFSLSQQQLSCDISTTNSELFLQLEEASLPITLSLAEISANLLVPLKRSTKPKTFKLGLNLTDVVASDLLWSLLDAGEVLPRTPLSLGLNISGKVKVLADLWQPDGLDTLYQAEDLPLELYGLSLDELTLSAAGAVLSGAGAFTFDNEDLVTFDGFPRPQGWLEAKISGGDTLIDRLIEIGLLPSSEAIGARMMLGMFTVPGEAKDTLQTTVEITKQGQVIANGQRIR